MKLEVQSTSNFLVHLVRLSKRNVSERQLGKFRDSLIEVFRRRYRDHWFPEKPFKGSGFRCIRINSKMDPIIGQAADKCGLSSQFLHQIFHTELSVWVDPREVSYRIGENGNICILYKYEENVTEPWKPFFQRNNKNIQQSQSSENKPDNSTPTKPSCNKSKSTGTGDLEYLLDPRKSVSIEQLAAFVSS